MKRKLYKDAINVLLRELKGVDEAAGAKQYLMLGECHYILKDYAKARPWFYKADKHLPAGDNKTVAQYRLACTAYRIGDRSGAIKRIDAFAAQNPTGRRTGTLLLFKMKLMTAGGKPAEADVEKAYKQITGGSGSSKSASRTYGPAIAAAADKVLTDYYVATGRQEKAMTMYASLVSGFRKVRSQYAREKRPIPRGLEQAHDNAAMQLGLLHAKANRYDDAVRWLENIRYDTELIRRGRLLLAQVAYKRRDFSRAAGYLSSDFMETVPKGAMRSDMYLVRGLSEAARSGGDPARVERYLQNVGPESLGYPQAQSQLGDLYRQKGFNDRAVAAYKNAESSAKYEAHSLYHLAMIHITQAREQKDKKLADKLLKQAAARFSTLSEKYPTSQLARLARDSMDKLLSMGYDLTVARSDTEKIRHWMKLVQSQSGQAPAARALLSIARLHHKAVVDKKTQQYVKPPNYAACAAACDKLLDAKTYNGKDFDPIAWRAVRTEALYLRGRCHLTSASAGKTASRQGAPTWLRGAKIDHAAADFQTARKLVDSKNIEMIKGLELGLLAAMLKSDDKELRKTGRTRFAELADEYGADPRFQQLAMDLADWYARQGRLLEAADEYKGLADRGATTMSRKDLLEALLAAGRLFSRAGSKAIKDAGERKYGILICPREVFKIGGLLKTYRGFRDKITVKWPKGAKEITAADALQIVAKASKTKFVWDRRREFRKDSVAYYLKKKKLRFSGLNGSVAEFLEQILDPKTHRMAFDIGLTDQSPTPSGGDEPTEPAIEIYDIRCQWSRHAPLTQTYGSWVGAHGGKAAMMFNVVKRVESLTGTKVLWADGVDKDTILAAEFQQVPGRQTHEALPCGQTLAALLDSMEMRFRIVPRNRAAEIFARAKDCYNDIRRIDPRSKHGEQSLFLLAMDFYRLKDYERMKIVLKEYLKLFDDPQNRHYHEACFWVGWVFENDNRLREACYWYNRAAAEQLVIFKTPDGEKPTSSEQLRTICSYDTIFALEESTSADFKDATLAGNLGEFVRLRSNVDIRLDAALAGGDVAIKDRTIAKTRVIDVLCDILAELQLSVKAENVNPKVAEKAYYRMASACNDDGMLDQALNGCDLMLRRFPNSSRRRDAFKLKLDICKGMKDYRTVLATMEQLKTELAGEVDAYQIDFEIAWIYFDLCSYKQARSYFQKSLSAAKDPVQRTKIRDGYARALLQDGDHSEALNQYRSLLKTESEPLRKFIDKLMVWYLAQITNDKTAEVKLPPDAAKLMRWYTSLTDAQRGRLPADILARATWVYYAVGMLDQHRKKHDQALERFQAAGNSPDDWLAAESLYRAGMIHARSGRTKEAIDAFQYMLISTKSTEGQVRGLFALARCQQSRGNTKTARMRFDQIINRFPDSPYAGRAKAKLSETQPAAASGKP